MRLNFNLENIKYLKLEYQTSEKKSAVLKLALREKLENEFIAITKGKNIPNMSLPAPVKIGFVCHDGLYITESRVDKIETIDGSTLFYILNPRTLDYQQNRYYYRIIKEMDCIYTVVDENGTNSYSAVTYDISAGGVSILLQENPISKGECSIVIMHEGHDIKAYLEFVRCEIFEDMYKLSFMFTDIDEQDRKRLLDLCVNNQLN